MNSFQQAAETISKTIEELREKETNLKNRELFVIQKDEELIKLSGKIEERVKQYSISPEIVEEKRIKNEKENVKLLEREQSVSIKEDAVIRREKEVSVKEENVIARFKDIEIRENDIKNRELELIKKTKDLRETIEKEVFDKIMKK